MLQLFSVSSQGDKYWLAHFLRQLCHSAAREKPSNKRWDDGPIRRTTLRLPSAHTHKSNPDPITPSVSNMPRLAISDIRTQAEIYHLDIRDSGFGTCWPKVVPFGM